MIHGISLSPETAFYARAVILAAATALLAVRYDRWAVRRLLKGEYVRQLQAEARVNRVVAVGSAAPACMEGDYCLDRMAPKSWMHQMSCPLNKYLKDQERRG